MIINSCMKGISIIAAHAAAGWNSGMDYGIFSKRPETFFCGTTCLLCA